MSELRALLSGDGFEVADWKCDGHDSPDRPEVKTTREVVFVRRGVFIAIVRGGETLLTANEAWLLPPAVPYRIRHPRGGDECTVLTISDELRDEYAGLAEKHVAPVTTEVFETQHRLWTLAQRRQPQQLAADECVRGILAAIHRHEGPFTLTPRHAMLVRRSREFLAAHVGASVSLREVASAAGSSPYHLSRVFRRATGQSLHGYQRTLRLRAALARLAAGERDLTRLALDLGFCDHSHFTRSFARTFGAPPSRWREL